MATYETDARGAALENGAGDRAFLDTDAAPVAAVCVHHGRMGSISNPIGRGAADGFDLCAGIDGHMGVSGGTQQTVFGYAGTAFDAGIRGLAIELDGMTAEKRCLFNQRYLCAPGGQRVDCRQTGHAGADDNDVFVFEVQKRSPRFNFDKNFFLRNGGA